ncbi:MAG TPA: helix-turn-helix transcriptional regulator [Nevskia sp.]|nr:helix-turn-helix transcriptional regulator [Nevskia sp.]
MGATRKPQLRQIFGTNLRRERLKLKMAQEKLAQEAGLTQTYISQLESAEFSASLDTIEKIARALDVDPSTLLQRG